MPMNVVGYESTASNAALTSVLPIPDPTVQVAGFDILVPPGMNNICFTSAMIASTVAPLRAQFRAPSLLAVVPYDMEPIANGSSWPNLWQGQNIWNIPLPLVVAEPLDFLTQNAASVLQRGFAHFCDGALKPVTGKIYTIRFTSAVSTITGTWQNGPIVFSSVLPAGNYQVVGARLWSNLGVYFRFVFKGSIWRPGAPMMTAEANQDWGNFRWGAAGIWDVFNNITPPSVDIVGVTDTAQTGVMDFIKIS